MRPNPNRTEYRYRQFARTSSWSRACEVHTYAFALFALGSVAAFAAGEPGPAVTTEHSTVLYATQATSVDGDAETLASHKVADGEV